MTTTGAARCEGCRRFGFRRGMFPVAESVSDTTLSLPLSAAMTEEAIDRVVEACHDVLR